MGRSVFHSHEWNVEGDISHFMGSSHDDHSDYSVILDNSIIHYLFLRPLAITALDLPLEGVQGY